MPASAFGLVTPRYPRVMLSRTDIFELGGLRLVAGEGRCFELALEIDPLTLGGERYPVPSGLVAARLDISRTTAAGYALRLRFQAIPTGPCMRCLQPAEVTCVVDAREIAQEGEIDDLASPYVESGSLDLKAWGRDSLALALPVALLCRADCPGLCPECGADLNAAGPEHRHAGQPDLRWAKLSEVRFE